MLSYSAITNYGKSTLPSVIDWGTDINILKDPPKSLYTRKIDKVGETSSITNLIDDSGDRACEAINVYARGVNPFVSVDYGNNGNNGGQRSGSAFGFSSNGLGASKQAYLPYRIIKDGAFRPPIMTKEQLLPLSRQTIGNIENVFANKAFADFTKKLMCPSDKYREVKEMVRHSSVEAVKTQTKSHQIIEPYEVKYVIQNPISVSADSGQRTRDLTHQTVIEPVKNIIEEPMRVDAITNLGSEYTIKHINNTTLNTDKYIQNTLHSDVVTNPNSSLYTTDINSLINSVDIKIKDIVNVTYDTPISSYTQDKRIHNDLVRDKRVVDATAITNKTDTNIYYNPVKVQYQIPTERNMPSGEITSNRGSNFIKTNDNINSRNAKLNPKITVTGGGESKPTQQTLDRFSSTAISGNSEKISRSKKILNMQLGRFNSSHPVESY